MACTTSPATGMGTKRRRTGSAPSRVPSLHLHDIEDGNPGLPEVVRHPYTQGRRIPHARAEVRVRRRTACERATWDGHEVSGARFDALVLPARGPARPGGLPRRPEVGGAGVMPGGRSAVRRYERIADTAALPRRAVRDRGRRGDVLRIAEPCCPDIGHTDAHSRCNRIGIPFPRWCNHGRNRRAIQEKRISHNTQTTPNAEPMSRDPPCRRVCRASRPGPPHPFSNLRANLAGRCPDPALRNHRTIPRGAPVTRMHCFDPQTDLVIVLLPVCRAPPNRPDPIDPACVSCVGAHRRAPLNGSATDCNPACHG